MNQKIKRKYSYMEYTNGWGYVFWAPAVKQVLKAHPRKTWNQLVFNKKNK